MAIKVFQHFLCICLFSVALPLPSHASQSKPKAENPTSFDFIKHLEGGRKGLQQLKTYLQEFGYINYSPNKTRANDNDFDNSLEAAVKTYQLNYRLKTTGTLDAQTAKNVANHTQNAIHTVSHFSCFNGNPKWPPTRDRLTYAFAPRISSDAVSVVAKAFNTWASQTQFRFSQSQNFATADFKIGFYRGDHGDGAPFAGPNGALTHSFALLDGRLHYNGDQSFSVNPIVGSFHLETVALHEIGHLLGLQRSSVQDAIMWPSIPAATIKGLHAEDIQGINNLQDVEPVRISSFVFQCNV
ncbi:metalloendoproteinase 2-MMP-like [Rhododendron vialii]|uniref:metalloendoproteinase 2-MMP-like n=1 Tax=Rhododendron vialii TaxID=182163 RepID=UPI00265FFEF6|nr:metalloendoproteinase 2-MMP-like [Rhododendron vialii]